MKKLLGIGTAALLVFTLTACGTATGGKDLEGIMNSAIEASENLDSFHVKMEMEQDIIPSGEEGEKVTQTSTIEMDYVTEPLGMYQTTEMTMMGMPIESETYFTEDGLYTKDSMSNQWQAAPKELSDSIVEMSKNQADASEQLKQLKEYAKDVKFEEKEDHYLISFKASGDEYQSLVEDTIDSTLPEGLMPKELLEGLKVNALSYTYEIDKKTYHPLNFSVDMDFDMEIEGEKVQSVQKMNGSYSKINEIDDITIPAEVKESAVEIDESALMTE
ncbi:DUF6612 family protein [Mangrovibacillus sp. Mu-81]|uniref:DUF6612 family protein n=1 Tax=Mangrovibacillus sp. Mu-81 TaxID=3121478 RepID=UPI002FE44F42